jgi:hypothetical protein
MSAPFSGIETVGEWFIVVSFVGIAIAAGFDFGPSDSTVRLS